MYIEHLCLHCFNHSGETLTDGTQPNQVHLIPMSKCMRPLVQVIPSLLLEFQLREAIRAPSLKSMLSMEKMYLNFTIAPVYCYLSVEKCMAQLLESRCLI